MCCNLHDFFLKEIFIKQISNGTIKLYSYNQEVVINNLCINGIWTVLKLIGRWFILRIYVALVIFQPYRDLEGGYCSKKTNLVAVIILNKRPKSAYLPLVNLNFVTSLSAIWHFVGSVLCFIMW